MTMNQKARAGDLVSRRKAFVFQHWGVMLDEQKVLHNLPTRGEHVSSLEDFGAGHEIVVHHVAPEQRAGVIDNALNAVANPRAYDLVINNCEHTVNRVVSGRAQSPQLQLVLVLVGVAILFRSSRA